MNSVVNKIIDSELLAKLEWISVVASSEFVARHGGKMDGPRSPVERALLDIQVACENAEFTIKQAIKELDLIP